jgi:two-component system, sensor histidine kinase and response regulator
VADALLELDEDRRCIEINGSACDLFGVAREGLIGERFDGFAPIELREAVATAWPRLLADGYAAGDCVLALPEGSRGVVEFAVQRWASPGRHILILRDVTASRALDAAQRSLSAVLERAHEAIYAYSLDGVLLSWNRGAEAIFGYGAEEAVGQQVAMLIPEGERAGAQEHWQRAWRGEPVEPFEALRMTKDARSIVVAVTLVTISDEFGAASGVVEITRDVTDAQYAQGSLSPSQAKAVESSQLQTQFLASMTHELRVPLNGVIGISRLLESTDLDSRQREYVQGLRVSGEGLALAIQAVLDFSKLETGALELADEPYDFRGLVEDVCSVVSLGAASEVEVLSYVEPDFPTRLQGDEQRVRQVLATIAANAVKLTPAGEVCVTARIAAENGADWALVEIHTGPIDIDGNEHRSVFDSLSNGGDLTWRNADTVGFGVTIAKRLVTMMGGEVRADRLAADGGRFSFTLPLRSEVAEVDLPPQTALEGERVLVVYANESGRDLVVRQLQGWDARVTPAAHHDAAVAALRVAADAGEPFAIALIDHRDVRASQLDAVALTRAIQSDPALRATRTVLLIAARDAPLAVEPDLLILKPCGQTRLYRELTAVITSGPRDAGAAGSGAEGETASAENFGRVLVAEDNAVNQMVAVRLLEQRGFIVDVANDGREAIILHAHHQYDAIFMDCQMPGINGYEATREIRRREGTRRHTPIIAMTASTLPSDRQRCIDEGMDDHTGKPVRPAALDHVISGLLASRANGS